MPRVNHIETDFSIFEIANNLAALDTFFTVYSNIDKRLAEFISENNERLYAEIVLRITGQEAQTDFGVYESFVEQIITYLQNLNQDLILKEESLQQKKGTLKSAFKKISRAKKSVSNIVNVTKDHGISWVPLEYKKAVAYSLIAFPTLFFMYESMRVSFVASAFQKDLTSFTNIILFFYICSAVAAAYSENKSLTQGSKIVFNPYATLLSLEITPILAGLISRTPKHVFDLSAVISAITVENHTTIPALSPVLAAIIAAGIWNSIDVGFTTVTRKQRGNKKREDI